MAQYISTDIVNAAQWLPGKDTESMRTFLQGYKSKVKNLALVVNVPAQDLSKEGSLDGADPSLKFDFNAKEVFARPTDYIVQPSASKFKVMAASAFEKEYQLSPEPDPSETPADPAVKSALNELTAAASAAATTAKVSVDGSDLYESEKWVTAADVSALKVAIFDAHITSHDPNATTAEVEAAIAVLTEAIDTFNDALQQGTTPDPITPELPDTPTPDKTALTGAIAAAIAAKTGATESVDGSNVDVDDTWVSADDVAALVAAIATAQGVVDDEEADQDTIEAAVTALNDAVQVFKNAAKAGLKLEADVDRDALTTEIASAQALKENVTASLNGEDIEPTAQWVTAEELEAFNLAITAAQTTAAKTDATQDEIDQAVIDLQSAAAAFGEAVQAGTKTDDPQLPANKTALSTAIDAAEAIRDGAIVSVDGSEVDSTDKWVPESAKIAFENAILSAKTVANDPDATDEDISEALEALNEAIATFGSAESNGTNLGQEPNTSALTTAINDAIDAKIDVDISANGNDVPINKKWVTSDDMDAFDEVLAVAGETLDNEGATQIQIDSAADDLVEAIAVFNAAKKNGKYTGITEGEVEPDWDD